MRSLNAIYDSLKHAWQHQQDKIAETPSLFVLSSAQDTAIQQAVPMPACNPIKAGMYSTHRYCARSYGELCNSTLGQANISMKKERSARSQELVRAWELFKAQIPGKLSGHFFVRRMSGQSCEGLPVQYLCY